MRLNGDLYRVKSMTDGEGCCTFCIELNPGHWIKESHFPGNPIVPGVFLLQMVTELASQKFGYPLYIRSIRNVKFISIMSPLANPDVTVKLSGLTPTDSGMKVQALFSDTADPSLLFAKMSMTLEDKII